MIRDKNDKHTCTVYFLCVHPCRVLELKNEMFKLELLEFNYFDDILTDMKLTPVSKILLIEIHVGVWVGILNFRFHPSTWCGCLKMQAYTGGLGLLKVLIKLYP